jgi:tetratricopeptide (TPR) repeat protein
MPPSKINSWAWCLLWVVSFSGHSAFSQTSKAAASPLAVAQAEIAAGRLDTAEQNLWTVLSSNPNQTEALILLGVIRGRQKRPQEAEALLRRALQLDPTSVLAHRNLASALIAQNKSDAALEEYATLVKLEPRDNQARVGLARLYVAQGKFAESLSVLDAIPANRLSGQAIPIKAASLLGVGKTQEAAALIPRVESTPSISAEMAEVFLNGHAPQYAIKIVDQQLRRSRHPSSTLYSIKGRALQQVGQTSAAMTTFREALAHDPKSVDVMLAMAAVEASQSHHPESLALLKRAWDIQPDAPSILRPLIIEAMKAGERNTASRAAHVLADKSADDLDDQYLCAAVMLEGKDYVSASAIFDKYVLERPNDSKAFLGLGIAELAQQHYDKSRTALERALQIDPSLADAEYQLAVASDQQGATGEEIQHLKRTIQLQPRHAKALASLGAQYLQSGDLQQANSLLEQSVAADPNDSKSQYDLALVLAKLGNSEEAKQHMERYRFLKAAEDAGKDPTAPPQIRSRD